MAAGLVQVIIKDGGGTERTGWFWSSDGTISGNLTPAHVLLNSAGAPIATGAGAVGATVLRVTLASDDPAVAALGAVGDAVWSTGPGSLISLQKALVTQALSSDPVPNEGDTAHDAADAGKPMKVGSKAVAGLAGVTLVASGDRTNAYAGRDGVLYTRPHCGLEDIVRGSGSATDTSAMNLLAAPGSGLRTFITDITVSNSDADTDTEVIIKSGSNEIWRLPAPLKGGCDRSFVVPLPAGVNEAITAVAADAATTIRVSILGFTGKL